MSEIDTRRCPAVCDECKTAYRYVTTATTAIRVCDCDDPPPSRDGVPHVGEQLEMEV